MCPSLSPVAVTRFVARSAVGQRRKETVRGRGWGHRQGRSRGCFQHGRREANGVFSLALLSFLLTSGGGPLLGTGGRSWLGALALPHLPSRGCHEREFKFQSRAEPHRTMALASAGGTFDLSGWLALQRHLSCLTSLLRCYLNNVLPCGQLAHYGLFVSTNSYESRNLFVSCL